MVARFATIEEARLAEFDWVGAGVGHDDLEAWYHQGPVVHDNKLIFELATAGVSPDVTARWWTATRHESETVMRALLPRTTTVEHIVSLLAQGELTD